MLQGNKGMSADTEIPTASMSDIAFLLLVFFIVTTSMNQDQGIGMTLPPPGEPMPIPKENIAHVMINKRGQIALKMMGRDYEIVPLGQLRGRVEDRIIANPNLVVSILAEPEADYRTFIDAMDEIRQAGLPYDWSKISIAQPYGAGAGP